MTVPAKIEGGGVSAELPVFPPNTMGTIQLCTDESGEVFREEAELAELPTEALVVHIQMG